jgi:hypothetical protein
VLEGNLAQEDSLKILAIAAGILGESLNSEEAAVKRKNFGLQRNKALGIV